MGTLDGGSACVWLVDLYLAAVRVGARTFRGVGMWNDAGRPQPLPMPPRRRLEGLYRWCRWLISFSSCKPGMGRLVFEVVREPDGYGRETGLAPCVGGSAGWSLGVSR